MGTSRVSRREFVKTLAAGLVLAERGHLERAVSAEASTLRVAAVQMAADLANVDANLLKVERLTRLAFSRGARWVILPEFFTSGIAFHPDMAKATRAVDGPPAQLLLKLAREGNAVVGGSFLAWRDGNAYNLTMMALVRRYPAAFFLIVALTISYPVGIGAYLLAKNAQATLGTCSVRQ